MQPVTLPVYYYLDHFREMLRFVETTYGEVLSGDDRAFIALFEGLSRDAQCLLIRMVNRRGAIFNRALFKYPEIADLDAAADELIARGQARPLHPGDYAAFARCLPKTALLDVARAAGFGREVRASWAKPRLTDWFFATVPFEAAALHGGAANFLALGDTSAIEFLLYLYFGKTADDLKTFALRDLGVVRTNRETSFSARFTDAAEARACFHYSRLLDRIEGGAAMEAEVVAAILAGPPRTTDYAADLAARAAHRVGLACEKAGDLDLAERLFRFGRSADCRERLVRLLYGRGDKEAAGSLLQEMIDDPDSDDEFTFASDFHARKFGGRRTGLCTDLLRAARTIVVDDTHRGNPEAGVAGVLRRQGGEVFFAENTLWLTLFGLLFWDELFESGQLGSGFDWLPHGLRDRSFHRRFAAQIDLRLAQVRDGEALPVVLRTVAARWGRPNGLFAWDQTQIRAVQALLGGAAGAGLAAILRLMAEDFRAMRDGFPDLMQVLDGRVTFVEVKAEGDAIRRNQLTRLRQLASAGIPAEIGRVDYRFDPEQDYVVVDIETTGGWASGDRVTEIGAVKVRNHEVIAEWHSLVNPGRSIPAKITALTGITNAMVRDAPAFRDIAESFMAFMADGIFVAHNVNFDYGFLASEYERLERRFRFPKLCTCAGMRRRYPGHRSYSLGSLCGIYGIALDEHHRALCDARAAARLLNLMNARRSEADDTPAALAQPA
jgi:DNA polymerase-3 subunit epsilon